MTRAGRVDPSPAHVAWRIEQAPKPTATTPAIPAITSTSSTTTTPATPLPAPSITVDAVHPGALINPGVFGSDYLAPFGGMGSFDPGSECVLAVVHHAADVRGGRGITASPRWDHRTELPVDAGDRAGARARRQSGRALRRPEPVDRRP